MSEFLYCNIEREILTNNLRSFWICNTTVDVYIHNYCDTPNSLRITNDSCQDKVFWELIEYMLEYYFTVFTQNILYFKNCSCFNWFWIFMDFIQWDIFSYFCQVILSCLSDVSMCMCVYKHNTQYTIYNR